MSKSKQLMLISSIGLIFLSVTSCSSSQAKLKSTTVTGQVIHINDSIFKQKIFNYSENKEWKYAGELPCIVDFYADWCAPCRQMSPRMDDMAKKYEGKIIIYKIDVDKERQLAETLGIGSLPTIIFISKSGKPQVARGAIPIDVMEKVINSILTN